MSFWGKLFGSDDVIKKATDGLYNGVDAAFFTDEEKSQHFVKMLKAYEPFKLAQRLLALLVGVPYVLVWIISAVSFLAGALMESTVAIEAAKELAAMNNQTLGLPFSIILGFYFGGGAVEGIVRAKAS